MSFQYNSQLDAFELYHRIVEEDARTPSTSGLGLPALGHALAGSAGTAISHLILYPLDLAITRQQVQKQLRGQNETPSTATDSDIEYTSILDAIRKIYKSEGGLRAFYTGCITDTTKSIVDAFLFFLVYTFLRTRRLQSLGKRNLPVPDELRIGVMAGALSKFVTTPLSQIVTRKQTAALIAARNPSEQQSTSSQSIAAIARKIHAERGITGFWAGYRASLILTLNPGLTFLFHNTLSRLLLPASKRDKPGPKLTFIIAALSKASASAVMYPFSLAKTRAQVSGSSAPSVVSGEKNTIKTSSAGTKSDQTLTERTRRLSALLVAELRRPSPLLSSLRTIYATEGLAALYAGLQGEVLKGFLGHGLTMLLKERIHVLIVSAYFILAKALKRRAAAAGAQGDKSGSVGWRDEALAEMGRVSRAVDAGVEEVREGMQAGVDAVREGAQEILEKVEEGVQKVGEKIKS